jgi:hypothetical protein
MLVVVVGVFVKVSLPLSRRVGLDKDIATITEQGFEAQRPANGSNVVLHQIDTTTAVTPNP